MNTQGNYVRSLIALYKALGGGWENQSELATISEKSIEQMRERTNWGDFLSPENTTAPSK